MHIIHNLSGQHNDLMIVDILFHIIFFLNGEFNGFFVGAGILCKSFLGSYAHYPQGAEALILRANSSFLLFDF